MLKAWLISAEIIRVKVLDFSDISYGMIVGIKLKSMKLLDHLCHAVMFWGLPMGVRDDPMFTVTSQYYTVYWV